MTVIKDVVFLQNKYVNTNSIFKCNSDELPVYVFISVKRLSEMLKDAYQIKGDG